jgi:hypothetical protein
VNHIFEIHPDEGVTDNKALRFTMRMLILYRKAKLVLFLLVFALAAYAMLHPQTPAPAVTPDVKAQRTDALFAMTKGALNDKEAFKRLIGSGADINAQDALGRTPLFYAVLNKNDEYVFYLLMEGADISLKDHEGRTVLDLVDPKLQADRHLYFLLVTSPQYKGVIKDKSIQTFHGGFSVHVGSGHE